MFALRAMPYAGTSSRSSPKKDPKRRERKKQNKCTSSVNGIPGDHIREQLRNIIHETRRKHEIRRKRAYVSRPNDTKPVDRNSGAAAMLETFSKHLTLRICGESNEPTDRLKRLVLAEQWAELSMLRLKLKDLERHEPVSYQNLDRKG